MNETIPGKLSQKGTLWFGLKASRFGKRSPLSFACRAGCVNRYSILFETDGITQRRENSTSAGIPGLSL